MLRDAQWKIDVITMALVYRDVASFMITASAELEKGIRISHVFNEAQFTSASSRDRSNLRILILYASLRQPFCLLNHSLICYMIGRWIDREIAAQTISDYRRCQRKLFCVICYPWITKPCRYIRRHTRGNVKWYRHMICLVIIAPQLKLRSKSHYPYYPNHGTSFVAMNIHQVAAPDTEVCCRWSASHLTYMW